MSFKKIHDLLELMTHSSHNDPLKLFRNVPASCSVTRIMTQKVRDVLFTSIPKILAHLFAGHTPPQRARTAPNQRGHWVITPIMTVFST